MTGTDRSAGTLFVCPTPIGNLEDITIRVLKVLRTVDIIAAEDTRKTRILLARYHIRTPMTSCHRYNEASRIPYLLECLSQGQKVALLSDAGMPGISDPGERVINQALEAGFRVEVLPGPSATVTALVASGLPARRFAFEGFLPRKASERRRILERLCEEERTMVFFEAPHRLRDTLADLREILGGRRASVIRELTKIHEEVIRADLDTLEKHFLSQEPRGEIVIVVSGGGPAESQNWDSLRLQVETLERQGKRRSEAVREVAQAFGVSRSRLYQILLNEERPPVEGR